MNLSKYRKSLILYIIYSIFWIAISIALSFLTPRGEDLTKLLPFNDVGIETILLAILLLPFSSIIGLFIGGYLFSPLFLYAHKKIFKNKVQYGIYNRPEFHKFKYFSQGLFSALMAINFSLFLLNPEIVKFSSGSSLLIQSDYAKTFVVLLTFTFIFSSILFSTTWFLMDSGILYSNKNKLDRTLNPPEIRSIGRWYGQFLKSYAGISVIFSYFEFIAIFLLETSGDVNIFSVLLAIFVPFPIFMVIPSIPALIVSDLIKKHRIHYLKKFARKLGIIHPVEFSFELRKQ